MAHTITDECIACGTCEEECEFEAIKDKVEAGRRLTDLQMERLSDLYDQYVREAA